MEKETKEPTVYLKRGVPKITKNKYGFPQLTLLTKFAGEETTDRFTFSDVIIFIDKHRGKFGKHVFLMEKDLMHVRASLINHLCYDCDSMPAFCPYEILLNKFDAKCQWENHPKVKSCEVK